MIQNAHTELADIGAVLLEDAYLAWFSAETECELALRAWFAAAPGDEVGAYLAYRAALDGEEAAARRLERFHAVAATCTP